jgi:hypothetical protein
MLSDADGLFEALARETIDKQRNHRFGTSTGTLFYQTLNQPFDLGLWLDRPPSNLERNPYINAIILPEDR